MSPSPKPDVDRLAFAHNLRGLAALAVVVFHHLLMFWGDPALIGKLIPAPPYPGSGLGAVRQVYPHLPINLGSFGVALFFLISGFVIPFSFRRHRALPFLVARAFRLWPVYACGLGLTLLSVWLTARWFHQPYTLSPRAVAAHLLWVRDLLWLPSLDGIGWTLEIEVKFYLLCALLAAWLRRGRVIPLAAIGLGCLSLALFTSPISSTLPLAHPRHYGLLYIAQLDAMMLSFMLIGAAFHYHYRGWISAREGLLLGGLLLACFVGQWQVNVLSELRRTGVPTYLSALGVFAVCYLRRGRLGSSRVLSRLADVSYPLYAVHGFAGYCYMRVFVSVWDRPWLALMSCLAASLGLAYGLHRLVEGPCTRLGKSLAGRLERWLPGRSPAAPAPVVAPGPEAAAARRCA
jgi:peptidoglycan/LPS O-acetylase OafA/YrhL